VSPPATGAKRPRRLTMAWWSRRSSHRQRGTPA
jgi:hypothetical protein